MTRRLSSLLVLMLAVIAWESVAAGQDAPAAKTNPEEQVVRRIVQDFAKAFNAGSPDKLTQLFFAGAEFTDDAGNVYKGAPAIRDIFARFFQKFPGATATITADSVWLVGPTLAIVDGQRIVTAKDDQPPAASRFTLVLMKDGGVWKIASGREEQADDVLSPHERLEPLAWLLGDWVNEGTDAVVQLSCKWSADKNYLLIDFAAKMQDKPALKSTQRIGWDPLTGKVKSWVFDSDGGYGTAMWSQIENHWVLKSSAVLPDGQTGSATIILEPRDKQSYIMKGFDRIRGDVAEPDFEVTIVRKPPAPAK